MKALVLSGGAARGAYEAGVAQALCEHEAFDIVCGTSIGAINAALVAQDEAGRLREIWASIADRDIMKLRPELAVLSNFARHVRGIRRGSIAARLTHVGRLVSTLPRIASVGGLAKAKGLCDSRNIHAAIAYGTDFTALKRTFIAGVTNLSLGTAEAFAYFPPHAAAAQSAFHSNEPNARALTAANYTDAVHASTALPPAFEPVDIPCADGVVRSFSDGALTNNTPIRQAIDAGATEITVVMLSHAGLRGREHAIRSLAHVYSVSLDASAERMLELDLKLARRINDDVYRGFDRTRRFVDIRVIAPAVPLHLMGMDFNNQASIDRVFAQGYADGERAAESA